MPWLRHARGSDSDERPLLGLQGSRNTDRKDERTVMKAARRTETDWSTMNSMSHRARASCPASGRGGGAFSSCQAGRARQTPPVCFPKLQRREQRPTTNAGQSSGRGGRQRSRFSELTDTLRMEAEPEQPAGAVSAAAASRRQPRQTGFNAQDSLRTQRRGRVVGQSGQR